ncbi:hypothetical protein DO021_22620 [Desulfobacter hydrogenophilus]|uniref:Uncharacterized protein n=1 Tax=Desulfobacter hydrogenophilus TaxID=2291 RepID=A0A328F8R1_9BACT|nr:hypothetical protein DO021_22620 [Desulfobacter hydrogenophilus]
MRYNNLEVVKSRIYSIFDLLYSQNAEKFETFKKSRKKVSKHESENLMYDLIQNVLSQDVISNS